jgi:hypothetical protein
MIVTGTTRDWEGAIKLRSPVAAHNGCPGTTPLGKLRPVPYRGRFATS